MYGNMGHMMHENKALIIHGSMCHFMHLMQDASRQGFHNSWLQ